jgi:hypothetical protein
VLFRGSAGAPASFCRRDTARRDVNDGASPAGHAPGVLRGRDGGVTDHNEAVELVDRLPNVVQVRRRRHEEQGPGAATLIGP